MIEDLKIRKTYLKILIISLIIISSTSIYVTSNPASSCTVTGTASKDCATIHSGNQATCTADPCCYWTTPPAQCNTRACSHADVNNPDICEGCDTCSGDWNVDDDRGALLMHSVTVQGLCNFQNGADIQIGAGGNSKTLLCNNMDLASTATCDIDNGALDIN